MKREEWLLVFIPLALTWSLDRVTKMWAVGLQSVQSYDWLHFYLHHNPGAMLGLFANLPAFLRIVSLSTVGAFLVCIYALIQFLLPIKTLKLRAGLSIVLGGILGNVTDRILWGYVVDFIVLGNQKYATPVFNIADAVQWVGYVLILIAVFKEGDLLWPENNARKKYWINRGFQLKYCAILMGIGMGISLVTMVFSFTYLRVTILELAGHQSLILDKFLLPFAEVFTLISIAFSLGLFTVGKVISHKVAGPIYAFERHMIEVMKDPSKALDVRKLKLRSKDEFKHLERLATQLQTLIGEHHAPTPNADTTERSA
jgi:signal peptidase II